MRRLASAAILLAATAALTGCIVSPPSAPPPPTETTQPPTSQPTSDPTSQPTSQPTSSPTSAPAEGAPTGTVEGSTAVITNEGVTWRLELLDFGPAPLDQLTEYGGDEGAPAPTPPAGLEVGWACFEATLEAAPDDFAAITDVVNDFSVPDGEDGWDYETVDRDLDLYGSTSEVGEVLPRVCPIVLVPEGFDYAAITLIAYDLVDYEDDLELEVPVP